MYNPYQHAWELNINVEWGKLSGDLKGFYDNTTRTITLEENLSTRQANCILAHEIVHAEFEDEVTEDMSDIEYNKMEKRCDKIAAQRLVVWPALVDAIKLSDDPGYWCAEMILMPWVLENFFKDLTPQERLRLAHDTGKEITKEITFP